MSYRTRYRNSSIDLDNEGQRFSGALRNAG